MKKSPLQQITETFGSKENLVKELKSMFDKGELFVERLNPDKGLACVANAKLLKLHATALVVKERFKTREGLIAAILEKTERIKDDGFRSRLDAWGLPRLWDYFTSIEKAASKAAKKAANAAK